MSETTNSPITYVLLSDYIKKSDLNEALNCKQQVHSALYSKI